MSIINKMHQGLKENHQDSPILSPMPVKKQRKRVLLFTLISLLLASSIGLSYLVYDKENANKLDLNSHSDKVIVAVEPTTQANAKEVALVKNLDQETIQNPAKEILQEEVVVLPEPISKPVTVPTDEGAPEKIMGKEEPKEALKVAPVTEVKSEAVVVNKPTPTKSVIRPKQVTVKRTPEKQLDASEGKKESHLTIKKSVITRSEWADIHLKKAEKALLEGNKQLAVDEKVKALSLKPELHKVRESLALYYFSIGEQEQAKRLLKKGAVEFPEYYDFNLMLSRIALKSGDQQKAYLYLQQSPPAVEGNLDYHVSYAVLAQKFKHYDRSEILYQGLLTQRPNNGRWRMSLAIAQDKLGKKKLAIENYNKALQQVDLSSSAKKYINQRLAYLANQ